MFLSLSIVNKQISTWGWMKPTFNFETPPHSKLPEYINSLSMFLRPSAAEPGVVVLLSLYICADVKEQIMWKSKRWKD